MIRKLSNILIIFFIFPTFVQALDWGIQEQFVENEDIRWGVEKLLNKQPIKYEVAPEVKPEEVQMFLANIQKWPTETLNYIKQSGRTKEFKDIIPILEHQFKLIQTDDKNQPDLKLVFESSNEDLDLSEEGGHINLNKGRIAINTQYRNLFDEITLHELGHYFGLADQEQNYPSAKVHPEYSSDRNLEAGSIMMSLDNLPGPHLTCDDADGFINLIDLYLSRQNNGKFSDRATNGWTSLCEDNQNLYREAQTINRNPQFKAAVAPYFYKVHRYVNGKRVLPDSWLSEDHANVISLFQFHNGDRIKRSNDGFNLVETITSNEDILLCSHGKQVKEIVREFYYNFYEDENMATITVNCYADQEYTDTYKISMKLNEKTIFSYYMDPKEENLNVPFVLFKYSFTIENNKIVRIHAAGILPNKKDFNQIIWDDNETWPYVANVNNEKYVKLNTEGNRQLFPGNEITNRRNIESLFEVHENITNDIQNFYKYFYQPLINRIQFELQQESGKQVENNLLKKVYKRIKESL